MSRMEHATRNIKYGYVGQIVQLVLNFASRTVFIKTLDITFLGVNGLYTNILGVLSLAELGVGMAMNYCLYRPIAQNDTETIKSLMLLYKKLYRGIALVVSSIGLLLVPFLRFIIKDPGNIGLTDLTFFYLIFLFNTVSTYFVAYKYSLVNAEQKNYIQTNIQTLTSLITIGMQIVALVLFRSFYFYLICGAVIGLLQKIVVNAYLNRRYPYLLNRDVKKLPKEETESIRKNVVALMYAKIGEICLYQTDNIIISSFINIATVGIISNYKLILSSVTGLVSIVFNSVVSSFGNLLVTETKERQFFLFKVYRFVAFWFYGFSTIAMWFLLSPFIQLWIGKEMLIQPIVVYLLLINFYMVGHATVVNNIKNVAGLFGAVKYLSLILAAVNLLVAIVLVRPYGLRGIYIGTVCATLVSVFTVPVIIYRSVFEKSAMLYYRDSVFYLIPIVLSIVVLGFLRPILLSDVTIARFAIMMTAVTVVPNLLFFFFCKHREEYAYMVSLVKRKIGRS